ncbi:MAG: HAMP domain-containing protein [Clostridia bacterium]|nr:HAMP domain-containing protein [Clostridia bacterium]
MKIRIRNKLLITICSLILLSLVGQIVFNQFLSKGFFMQQQKGIIGEAFEQIKTGYSDDLADVNSIAENLQDTYGIKTVISDNGEIVYSSGYSFMLQGQRPGMNLMFHNAEFTDKPTATLIEGKGVFGDTDRLQLAGSFSHSGEDVRVLMTLQIAAIDNSIAVFTESNIYISLAVLLIGSLIALVVSKTISRPITNMEAVSKQIAKLDFSCAADEDNSTAELASLAYSINQMSRQLDRNMRDLTAANA